MIRHLSPSHFSQKMVPLPILRRKRRDLLKNWNAKMKRMDITVQKFRVKYNLAWEQYASQMQKLVSEIARLEKEMAISKKQELDDWFAEYDKRKKEWLREVKLKEEE